MFKTVIIAATLTAMANAAMASDIQDSRIAELCGADHVNEAASMDDIRTNPDGYYIASIGEQISLGDDRIVLSNANEPYFCTRPAALPYMDAVTVARLQDERVVRWLFVQPHPLGN